MGLLVDGLSAPAWVRQVVEEIRSGTTAEIVIVVINEERVGGLTRRRLTRFASSVCYRAYQAIDRRVFRSQPDAFAETELGPLLTDVQLVGMTPERKGFVHRFDNETIELLQRADLDVVIRFGFNIIKGDILNVARYGVWSYHHGDSRYYRGGPPFFWEMFEGNETAGVILQTLNETLDGGRIIYRSLSATDRTSLWRGRNAAYWKGAHFVGRCLRDLRADPAAFELSREPLQPVTPYTRGIYRTPTNRQMLTFLLKLAKHGLSRLTAKALWTDQWTLGFRVAHAERSFEVGEKEFSLVRPPSDRFFADPFLLERGGVTSVFFEELPYKTNRGFISVARVDTAGRMQQRRTALVADHHLSYPCAFEESGDVFLVPEAYEGAEIAIYKAERYPVAWRRVAVVSRGVRAVDPTLFRWENRCWLFCNIATPGMSPNEELHLFHASAVEGPWVGHARNPIVSDVTCARPAGLPFMHDGRLVRPAQDCSGSYGRSVRFMAIDQLDTDAYREHEIGALTPSKDSSVTGVHTYNTVPGLVVTDLRKRRRRWSPPGSIDQRATLVLQGSGT